MTHFADRLIAARARSGPLCLGLDPFPDRIPALFGQGIRAVEAFFGAVIAASAGSVEIVKPQIALFEVFGPDGLAALSRLTHLAREAGMLVLLDAKRGDIGSTARGYADAYLGPDAWLHADAITVNPYMGLDTVEPYLDHAGAAGKGVIVLVRTSNPGAADFQDRLIDGEPLYLHVARAMAARGSHLRGKSGWSSLMMVVGATAPQEALAVRAIAPDNPFLVPGFGAQGAGPAEALVAERDGTGIIVNSSRGLLYPDGVLQASSLEEWRAVFENNLRQVRHALGAVSREGASHAS